MAVADPDSTPNTTSVLQWPPPVAVQSKEEVLRTAATKHTHPEREKQNLKQPFASNHPQTYQVKLLNLVTNLVS